MQDFWVKVDSENDIKEEPWVGKLSLSEARDEQWQFELIRNSDTNGNPFSYDFPFKDKTTLCGLLDLQTDCTLVYPLATKVDPGSVGVYHKRQRRRAEGIFQALISRAAIEDIEEPKFSGFGFSSDSFLAWYGRRGFETSQTDGTNLRQSTELPHRTEIFGIDGFGQVTCRAGTAGNVSIWESIFTSVASIWIEFETRQSLKDTMLWCWKFETLFQFLTGLNTKWPNFTLNFPDKFSLGEYESNFDCELIFGRTPHTESKRVHSFECCHNYGRGAATLESILNNFCKTESIYERVQAVNHTRFAKRPVTENFSAIVPVLEKYLNSVYMTTTEASFLQHQQAFFKHVESSHNPEIIEFSKKHITIKDKKSASLKTLLERAADTVNGSGFSISKRLTRQIAERRSKLFHQGASIDNGDDARQLWAEAKGAAALLSLHTYRDLGIDIGALEPGRSGNCEIRNFFKSPIEKEDGVSEYPLVS